MSEETKQELRKCSTCRCNILLDTYFSKNRQGDYKKTCDRCLLVKKNNSEFTKESKKSYNRLYHKKNKNALAAKKNAYREKNKEYITEQRKQFYNENKDKLLIQNKEYRDQNKESVSTQKKEYYQLNKELIQCKNRIYHQNNLEYIRARDRRYQADGRRKCEHNKSKRICKMCEPAAYLRSLVASRIRFALKRKTKGTLEYLGCEISTFREHLENSFKDGMTWENQGEWEIDHIIPVFYRQDGVKPSIDEVGKRLHYTNCQAMWAAENMSKSNRYIGDYQSESESGSTSSTS